MVVWLNVERPVIYYSICTDYGVLKISKDDFMPTVIRLFL